MHLSCVRRTYFDPKSVVPFIPCFEDDILQLPAGERVAL
jgi:hypothetical protein